MTTTATPVSAVQSWRWRLTSTATRNYESNVRSSIVPSSPRLAKRRRCEHDEATATTTTTAATTTFEDSRSNTPGSVSPASSAYTDMEPDIGFIFDMIEEKESGDAREDSNNLDDEMLDDMVDEFIRYIGSRKLKVGTVFFSPEEFEMAVWLWNLVEWKTSIYHVGFDLEKLRSRSKAVAVCQSDRCTYKVKLVPDKSTIGDNAPMYVVVDSRPHSWDCHGSEEMDAQCTPSMGTIDRSRVGRVLEDLSIKLKDEKGSLGRLPSNTDYENTQFLTTRRMQYLHRLVPDTLTIGQKRQVVHRLLERVFHGGGDAAKIEQLSRQAYDEYLNFGEDEETDNIGGLYVLAAYLKSIDPGSKVSLSVEENSDGLAISTAHIESDHLRFKKHIENDLARMFVVIGYGEMQEMHLLNPNDPPVDRDSLKKYVVRKFRKEMESYDVARRKIEKAVDAMYESLTMDTKMNVSLEFLPPPSSSSTDVRQQVHELLPVPDRTDSSEPRLPSTDTPYEELVEEQFGFSIQNMQFWSSNVRYLAGTPAQGIFLATSPMQSMAKVAAHKQWYLQTERAQCDTENQYDFYSCSVDDVNGNPVLVAVAYMLPASYCTWATFLKTLKYHYSDAVADIDAFCCTGENGVIGALTRVFPNHIVRVSVPHVERAIACEYSYNKWKLLDRQDAQNPRGALWHMFENPSAESVAQAKKSLATNQIASYYLSHPEWITSDSCNILDMSSRSLIPESTRTLPVISALFKICDDHVVDVRRNCATTSVTASPQELRQLRSATVQATQGWRGFYHLDYESGLTVLARELNGCVAKKPHCRIAY